MNLYDVLGVGREASTDEIRAAYKKLAKKYHPDINPNDANAEKKFKEVSSAYNTLSDSEKRQMYNAELDGHVGFGPGGPNLNDIFGGFIDPFEVFNRGPSNQLNIVVNLRLGFLEPKAEHQKLIKFMRKGFCKSCSGSGAKSFGGNCKTCHGTGQVKSGHFGLFSATQICNLCNGSGKHVKEKCNNCQRGLIEESVEVKVSIPAGITPGKYLRVPGEGSRSPRGNGDLLIHVDIDSDPRWVRHNQHVSTKVEVYYPSLVLGDEVQIETIWGPEKLVIPAGTEANTRIPLYNKGFPVLNGMHANERGAHTVTIALKLPGMTGDPKHQSLLNELKKFYQGK